MNKDAFSPINRFLREYSKSGSARFHMPGHKGRVKSDFSFDITEIKGADSLYEASGIINRSERTASEIYNTRATAFSAGGSTLCIQSMLRLALSPGDVVVCARNAHIAFHNSIAMFDIIPHWIYPRCSDGAGVSGQPTADEVEKAIAKTEENGKKAKAVYITSPDYTGGICDIASIAKVCSAHAVMLLVDNAHGAHLAFTPQNRHPIALGATLCCDSAHKTLPVLTGGAYLHSGADFDISDLKRAMSLVGSTSPSYLILNSLDCCNEYLKTRARADFAGLCEQRESLAELSRAAGFKTIGTDCTKLSLLTSSTGRSAEQLAEQFREFNIECEYAAGGVIVFLMTPFNSKSDFKKLKTAICALAPSKRCEDIGFEYEKAVQVITPHEALWSKTETVPLSEAVGRISAGAHISCPPGVPVISYGELVTENVAERLKNSGKATLTVVK